MRKHLIVLFLVCGWLSTTHAQFEFGGNISAGLAQIEKDNLKGFNKLAYELGLVGGYRYKNNNLMMLEMKYSSFGSTRQGEEISNTSQKALSQINLETYNIFLGHAFCFGDSWVKSEKYRFSSGLRIHNVTNSELTTYRRDSLTTVSDAFDWIFLTMKFGPGLTINDHLTLDLLYEHSIYDFKYESDQAIPDKLVPFNFYFSLSYYL